MVDVCSVYGGDFRRCCNGYSIKNVGMRIVTYSVCTDSCRRGSTIVVSLTSTHEYPAGRSILSGFMKRLSQYGMQNKNNPDGKRTIKPLT